MKKIKIELTEEQLRLISESLDFYSRIGIGQFSVKDGKYSKEQYQTS